MKKNNIIIAIGISLLLMALSSCDDSETPAKPTPDAAALQAMTDENIEAKTQHFTIDATTGGQIKGTQGTIVEFPASAFLTAANGVVTGTVDIELIEIYTRSSMLLTQKATIGKKDNGDKDVLISGGEFYVNVTKDGNVLKPESTYTIIVPTNNTGGPDVEMNMFNGVEECENDTCNMVWVEQKDRKIEIGEFQDVGGVFSAYYAIQSKFGWTNIDKWYNDPRTKTTIFVEVPEGYDNTNCALFIVYDGEPTALGRFDKYDDETNRFTEHYGLIPIGLNVHIILVSIIDDEIHYAMKGTTIVENHIEVISDSDLHTITEEELVTLIDDLP